MVIYIDNIYKVFGYGKISELAKRILNRVDVNNTDTNQALWEALDDSLIYIADEWTVIQYYCTPRNILPYFDVTCKFHTDLLKCIKEDK